MEVILFQKLVIVFANKKDLSTFKKKKSPPE